MLAKRDTPIIRGAFKSVGKNQRRSTAVFSIVFENNTSLMDYFLPTIFFRNWRTHLFHHHNTRRLKYNAILKVNYV